MNIHNTPKNTSIWTNDEDLVVAASPKEASNILQKICGCTGSADHSHDDGQLWEMIGKTQKIILYGISASAQVWIDAGHQGLIGKLTTAGGQLELGVKNSLLKQ